MPPNMMQVPAGADEKGPKGGEQAPIDTVAVKKQLAQELGDKFAGYWRLFRLYVVAKQNKQELDFHLQRLLTPKALSLHNKMVAAICFNASVNARNVPLDIKKITIKQDVVQEIKRKRKGAPGEEGGKEKKKSKKALASEVAAVQAQDKKVQDTPTKRGKKRTLAEAKGTAGAAGKETKAVIKKDGPVVLLGKKSHVTPFSKVEENHESCNQCFDFPDFITLKRRMLKIAQENNVHSVSDDCVSMVMRALEQRMKDILEKCSRLHRPRTLADVQQPTRRVTRGSYNVSARSFSTALNISPYLLGEDYAMNQERALTLQTLGVPLGLM